MPINQSRIQPILPGRPALGWTLGVRLVFISMLHGSQDECHERILLEVVILGTSLADGRIVC